MTPQSAREVLTIMRRCVAEVNAEPAFEKDSASDKSRWAWARLVGVISDIAQEQAEDIRPTHAFRNGRKP